MGGQGTGRHSRKRGWGPQVLDKVERDCCGQDWLDLRRATGLKRLQLRGVPAAAFSPTLEVPHLSSHPLHNCLLSSPLQFANGQERFPLQSSRV